MDKETHNLKLKILGTLRTTLIFFAVAIPIFNFEMSYIHNRDSSRTYSSI